MASAQIDWDRPAARPLAVLIKDAVDALDVDTACGHLQAEVPMGYFCTDHPAELLCGLCYLAHRDQVHPFPAGMRCSLCALVDLAFVPFTHHWRLPDPDGLQLFISGIRLCLPCAAHLTGHGAG